MSKGVVKPEDITAKCAAFIAEQLQRPVTSVHLDTEFDDFGLDSALVTSMLIDLEEWLGVELSPSLVFEEPTVRRLSLAISQRLLEA